MAEFDEKLNSILANPDAMAQIMQLAQTLSGDGQGAASPQPPPAPAPPQQSASAPPAQPSLRPPAPPPQGGADLLSSLASGVDPTLLMKLMPLSQELGSQNASNARQLLYALRPYLKPERQEKVERALQLARLFHLGKKFLSEWGG